MQTVYRTDRRRVVYDPDRDYQVIDPPDEFEGRYKTNGVRILFFENEDDREPLATADVALEEERYGVDTFAFTIAGDDYRDAFYEVAFVFDPALDDPYVELDTTTVDIVEHEHLADLDAAEFSDDVAAELEQLQGTRGHVHWIYPPEVRDEVDYVRIEVPDPDGGPESYLFADLVEATTVDEEGELLSQGGDVPAELAGHEARVTYLASPDG